MKNTKPLNALWQDLNRLQPSDKWSEKDRHAFRVGLKRLRVLLRLMEKLGYAELGEWETLFSNVFHEAGKRRELEILQKLSAQYKVKMKFDFAKIPAAQKGLQEDWKLNYPVWRDWFNAEFGSWKTKKMEKLLRKWNADFCRATTKMSLANVHDLRKKAKRLVYAAELCGLTSSVSIKALKQFAEAAGDWHDLELFVLALEKAGKVKHKLVIAHVKKDQKVLWKSLKATVNQLS